MLIYSDNYCSDPTRSTKRSQNPEAVQFQSCRLHAISSSFFFDYVCRMSGTIDIDGPLYIEVNKIWEEVYVTISGTRLQAFKRIREDVPASRSNKSEKVVMQVILSHTTLGWLYH